MQDAAPFAGGPGGGYGAAAGLAAPGRRKAARSALGLTGEDMAKAVACVLLPPMVFTFAVSLLCFRFRFLFPRGAWLVACLALAPAAGAALVTRRAARVQTDARWQKLATLLLLAAFVAAAVVGDVTYWYFSQPFFLLDSLREYTDVNPSEVDGVRLMDAGRVHFSEGARLVTDMAMSFTSWDIYCVAPITTSLGLPSQGSRLATYDLWAVGVNCCKSAQTDFRCGEYDDVDARAGLRQVSAEQRPYLRLAVQQAEAAYDIEAKHPIFFYWVKDPLREQALFFEAAFGNWVLANSLHFAANAFSVLAFVVLFNKGSRSTDSHLMMALGPA